MKQTLAPLRSVGHRSALASRMASILALALSRRSPDRICAVLHIIRRGARPATTVEAAQARRDIVAASVACDGNYCLRRSLAVAILCRLRGCWPTWCTGVRAVPLTAHAWVAVNGRPVGEPAEIDEYRILLSVGAAGDRQ